MSVYYKPANGKGTEEFCKKYLVLSFYLYSMYNDRQK